MVPHIYFNPLNPTEDKLKRRELPCEQPKQRRMVLLYYFPTVAFCKDQCYFTNLQKCTESLVRYSLAICCGSLTAGNSSTLWELTNFELGKCRKNGFLYIFFVQWKYKTLLTLYFFLYVFIYFRFKWTTCFEEECVGKKKLY